METTNGLYESLKTKHVVYGLLLAAALSWPWIWMAAAGSSGEGAVADLLSLGLLPTIIIGAFILYKETKSHPTIYKWAFTSTLAAVFLLVWIIPAVGIFGRSGDPADLIYFGVIVVGVIGAFIFRFRPQGMARTLVAMAIAQMLAGLTGLILGWGFTLVLNGFFAVLWLGSAYLFSRAAQDYPEA